jgi:outer membrane protein OmpA-like peptidoglycan-associated protein
MRIRLLTIAIAAVLSAPSLAQDSTSAQPSATSNTIPLTYVSANHRISLGIDDEGDISGELLNVTGYNGARALLTESWYGKSGAYGFKASYNWLWGASAQDAIDNPEGIYVTKGFLAYDRNAFEDDKLTFGIGLERNDVFGSVYLMTALSDERLVGTRTTRSVQTITGTEAGRPFTQDRFTDNLFETFEQAWDNGLGVRGGRFFDDQLWRMRGGIDYERGDFSSNQLTGSVGLDKYFENTGHSLSLDVEFLSADGDFFDESDTRVGFYYRYEWGQSFRPAVYENQIEAPAPAPVEQRKVVSEPKIVHNEIKLSSDAFFDFDKSEIRAETRAELDILIAQIKGTKLGGPISIVGHTCSIGSDRYNISLSQRRAASVRQYFLDAGIREEVITDAKGEAEPEYPNDSRDNRKKNRRVDIDFITIEETVTPGEETYVSDGSSNATWTKQDVNVPAGWVERALKNMPDHKREVDTYQYVETTTTVSDGPRTFLNRPPVAVNDVFTLTAASGATMLDVLVNDSDPDGNPLVIASVSQPASGSVQSVGNALVYTPATNAGSAAVTFTYTISDGQGGTATATVTINVVAGTPNAVDDSATTPRATAVNIPVLANDVDPEGQTLTIGTVGTPANGTASIVNGAIRYTPNAGFAGTDTFTYTAVDTDGNSDSATVTVTVSNAAPLANNDTATTAIATPVTISVLANDSDPEGDALSLLSVTTPANGTASVSGNQVIYTPAAGFSGSDTFSYTVSDSFGATSTATVTVNVQANAAPTANADTALTSKARAVIVNVLANDTDPEGDTLSVTRVVSGPSLGRTTVNADGTITYTHNPGPVGVDSFVYEISDGRGNVATGTVTVTILREPTP